MIERDLPLGWAAANVDALGDFINGCAFKPEDWVGKGTPIVRIQNLTDPDRPLNMTERMVGERYVIERGDILVSWSATLDVFKWHGPRAYVNQHIFKVVPNPEFDKGFVFFALKESIQELLNSEHLHGTTMKHINRKPFLAHPVPVPPLNEQRRIVEKIESLFARLDKGEEALRDVQKLLARYRQSVLKAAVTGQLTADWRAENAHRLEPGQELLARILQTRRETWDGRGKYMEPTAPDTTDLPELPEGWVWASLDSLIMDGPTNGISPKEVAKGGSLSFKLTATTSGEFLINDDTVKRVGIELEEDSKYWLTPGDVLIQRGNTIEYVGTAAIFPGPAATYIYPDLMMRVRFSDGLLAKWAVRWINFEFAKRHFRRHATGTAGNMPKINGTTLRSLPVPLPPRDEIATCLDLIELTETKSVPVSEWCQTELARSAALRQSILKDAFAGRLVPQDPTDEPAAALLARIRETRAAAPAKTRRKARA